jgi:hypothetical protein
MRAEPQVIITFLTGISGTDSTSITLNGKTITLNQSISDNDVVIFNTKTKDVSINGVGGVDYS